VGTNKRRRVEDGYECRKRAMRGNQNCRKHRREGTGCLHDITSARRKEGMLDPEKE
jgi:hypothetical protein